MNIFNIFNIFNKKTKSTDNVVPTWTIDKSFNFSYGHRVWSQKLKDEFCSSGDNNCKCRFLHGHEGLLHVFLKGTELERGMVTDFKHLGWLKDFLDDTIDHKFILDLNDPWFVNIINAQPKFTETPITSGSMPDGTITTLTHLKSTQPLNTQLDEEILVRPQYVPGTDHFACWTLDTDAMAGPEKEFFEGFVLVDFLPTSENLCKWIYHCIDAKMSKINVDVSKVTWNETPKSRAEYSKAS